MKGDLMATMIRTMNPYGFRCGEWATLISALPVRGRDCYLVRFDDGASDFWVVADPLGWYEFADADAIPAL